MTSFSDSTVRRPRKWDAEIITARQQPAWLAFEAGIHQNETAGQTGSVRARVARALDRYGLGTSDITTDEALDYLTNKELGQSARHFNRTGKAQFNQQQITHAVLSFMARKEQQRHITDCPIHTDDHDDDTPGSVRASHLPDPSHLRPDEYAARRDALRAINAMIPETDRELYDIMLAVREPGTRARIHSYASRHGIGQSGVYARIEKLAQAIQRHPWLKLFAPAFSFLILILIFFLISPSRSTFPWPVECAATPQGRTPHSALDVGCWMFPSVSMFAPRPFRNYFPVHRHYSVITLPLFFGLTPALVVNCPRQSHRGAMLH